MPNYKTKNYRFNRTRGLLSCAALLFPGISGAFSLGPLEIESYLGQQLSAKVVVYPSQMENLDDLNVDLENQVSDGYYGLESPSLPVMSQIKYSLEKHGDHYVVHFKSTSIVDEPLISFSVNFSLGAQTIGRDFTVALDPQVFSKYKPTANENYNMKDDYYDNGLTNDSSNLGKVSGNSHGNGLSRNFPEPDFEHWSLDYDSDSISDSDDWSELTEDLDAAVLSIDTAQVDSDHADVNQPAYVVQSGDTIKSIASRYTYPSARAEDMANAILRMNSSLRSNVEGNLVPGQIVILPNPDQLNVISSDNSELLSKEEGVFAKKKFYVHKQKPFYGEEKKVLRKKKIGKNHLLNNHHVTKKNVVRVESAVLSSTGLGSSEEDIISEHHKKSYDPGAVSAQVNALREEIEKLKQKIKEEKTTVADVGNGSGSSVISKSHKSEAVNLVPVPKTIVPVPNTSVPELAQDVKISGKTNIGPGHNNLLPPPGLVIPEQGSYDGDKSVVDLLMTLISSPAAITIAVVVCVLVFIAYILIRRRRRVKENLPSSEREIHVADVNPRGSSAEQKEYMSRNKHDNHEESTSWSGNRDWSVSDSSPDGSSIGGSVMKHRVVGDPISEADVYVQYGRLDEAAKILEEEYQKKHNVEVSLKLAEIYHVMKRFSDITKLASGMLSAHGATSSDWSNFASGMDNINLGDYLPQGTESKISGAAKFGGSFFSPGSLKKHNDDSDTNEVVSGSDRKLKADRVPAATNRSSNVGSEADVSDNRSFKQSGSSTSAKNTATKSGIDFVPKDKDKSDNAKTKTSGPSDNDIDFVPKDKDKSDNAKTKTSGPSDNEPEKRDSGDDGLLNFDLDLSELNEDDD